MAGAPHRIAGTTIYYSSASVGAVPREEGFGSIRIETDHLKVLFVLFYGAFWLISARLLTCAARSLTETVGSIVCELLSSGAFVFCTVRIFCGSNFQTLSSF